LGNVGFQFVTHGSTGCGIMAKGPLRTRAVFQRGGDEGGGVFIRSNSLYLNF
jgi:hypothetical protein